MPALEHSNKEVRRTGLETLLSKLRFDCTIPRALVHKNAIEHVFVTDMLKVNEDEFLCATHLPKMHAYFNDGQLAFYDTLLLTESGRQGCVALCHEFLQIPMGYAFILNSIAVSVADVKAFTIKKETSLHVVKLKLSNRQYRKGSLVSLDAESMHIVDGVCGLRGRARWSFYPPGTYLAIRKRLGGSLARPGEHTEALPLMKPDRIGGECLSNMVISELVTLEEEGRFRAGVRVNTGHPFFFDHDMDHIPGMLLMEACRQMALASSRLTRKKTVIEELESDFSRFAELGVPVVVDARVGPQHESSGKVSVGVDLSLSQGGVPLSKVFLKLASYP